MKIVFFATPSIAIPSLNYLLEKNDIDVLAVVCQPDRPAGRGHKLSSPPMKIFAEEKGLKIYQPHKISKDSELLAELKLLESDFFVTFAFGQILSQEILDIPKYGTINLHASLLPEYRGANPIQIAILEGKKKTGITTMFTELELDAGSILLQEEIEIGENMTTLELSQIISEKSPELIYKTLNGLKKGNVKPVEQDPSIVTLAQKLKKEDSLIDWNKTSTEIHNKIRACVPQPLSYTFLEGKRIKILESVNIADNKSYNAGEILNTTKSGLEIGTKSGKILITKVQPEGKKTMNAYDWANGARIKTGRILGE